MRRESLAAWISRTGADWSVWRGRHFCSSEPARLRLRPTVSFPPVLLLAILARLVRLVPSDCSGSSTTGLVPAAVRVADPLLHARGFLSRFFQTSVQRPKSYISDSVHASAYVVRRPVIGSVYTAVSRMTQNRLARAIRHERMSLSSRHDIQHLDRAGLEKGSRPCHRIIRESSQGLFWLLPAHNGGRRHRLWSSPRPERATINWR